MNDENNPSEKKKVGQPIDLKRLTNEFAVQASRAIKASNLRQDSSAGGSA